jgi:hypothetical protein
VDGGGRWTKLGGGVPTIPFRDLAIQKRENDLVGATFGRGFYILDDYSPLREVSSRQLEAEATLFPVRPAPWYIPQRPLGDRDEGSKASRGDGYFVAPNPPFGAVFAYYLAEGYPTTREAREKADRKANEAGNDARFPGFDRLLTEAAEDEPVVLFEVRDSEGALVRRIAGPTEPGFHRVAWNLRYPETSPWTEEQGDQWLRIPGPLAPPGNYTVTMSKRIDGVETALAGPLPFEVRSIREATLEGASPEEVTAFLLRLDRLRREAAGAGRAVDEGLRETGAIQSALLRSTAPEDLHREALALEKRLRALKVRLAGDPEREKLNTPGLLPVSARVGAVSVGTSYSAYGPTPNLERSLTIGEDAYQAIAAELEQILGEALPALREQLRVNGVPWTPGRLPGAW